MKNLIALATLVALLAGCAVGDEGGGKGPGSGEAWLSIALETLSRGATRASEEEQALPEESALVTLRLITFDDTDGLVPIPDGNRPFAVIDLGGESDPTKPGAVKISAAATNLVVIANPGPRLEARLSSMTDASTLDDLTAAIEGIDIDEIVGDNQRGFAMITAGDESDRSPEPPDNTIEKPYVDIEGRITIVRTTDPVARTEAEKDGNRVPVRLERLAARVSVAVDDDPEVLPAGAEFDFGGWTVEGLNTACYPFAVKTILAVTHSSTLGSYVNNFYTRDPNYDEDAQPHTGIAHTQIDATTAAPLLPWNARYDWMDASTDATPVNAYLTENTMAPGAQRHGNATRVVIRGTYTPAGFTSGDDWFRWRGTSYETFEALQEAYNADGAPAALKTACDDFYAAIAAHRDANDLGAQITATNFETLDATQLAHVENGGQVVKSSTIRWYQGGLNYYARAIRHDNEVDGAMALAKYGVVRNNLYRLTLNSVSGPGTPWYPSLEGEQGDPQSNDPLDREAGWLGITVSVGEWILWETGLGI